jgi:GntR family transcriptional regulator/MocR family aminotransferase
VAAAKYYADLHSEMIGQLTLADLIATHGYDRHVRACRLRYRRRRDLLVDRLAQLRHVMVDGIAAGLHAVIRLSGPTEQAVLAGAAAAGLAIGALRSHWHTAGDRPTGLVAGYGGTTDAAYPAALDVLVRVLRAAHGQATSGECP